MRSINWKIFILSLVAQFIITFLINLGIRAPKQLEALNLSNAKVQPAEIAAPILPKIEEVFAPQVHVPDIFEQIKVKLEEKKNDFELKKHGSLIEPIYAGAVYDQANGYIVIDYETGEILAERNAESRIPIASLTKIMTAVVALDLAAPEEVFAVTEKAARMIPTKIGVVAGQRMNLGELLNASLLTSANDAIEVIKQGIDLKYGKPGVFINSMNAKAESLGLKNTHFENPQGFDGEAQYSSAADLAVLTRYALEKYTVIKEIVKKDYEFLPANENHKQFDLYNWNGLLGVYPGVQGVKIGNTGKAGYTTVVVSEREGKKVLVVLLGAPGVLERDLWAGQLLDLGFEKLGILPVGVAEGELRAKYSTWKYWS